MSQNVESTTIALGYIIQNRYELRSIVHKFMQHQSAIDEHRKATIAVNEKGGKAWHRTSKT